MHNFNAIETNLKLPTKAPSRESKGQPTIIKKRKFWAKVASYSVYASVSKSDSASVEIADKLYLKEPPNI